MGVSSVGYVAIPMLSVSVFCRDEPVNSIEALKSKKLRVWARDQVETFTRLGVAAQIIPQEEMYVAMKTGVVDCALYPALYAHTVSLQEVAKHASFLYPMASGPYVLGVATDRWDATDESVKAAIGKAAEDLWNRTNQYEDDFERELAAREKLVEQGVTWGEDFPQADRDPVCVFGHRNLEDAGRRSRRQGARLSRARAEGLGTLIRRNGQDLQERHRARAGQAGPCMRGSGRIGHDLDRRYHRDQRPDAETCKFGLCM